MKLIYHEKYHERDGGRLCKTPEETRGQRPPGGAGRPHHGADWHCPIRVLAPLLEASSTASEESSWPLVKSVGSYGAR